MVKELRRNHQERVGERNEWRCVRPLCIIHKLLFLSGAAWLPGTRCVLLIIVEDLIKQLLL